MSATTDDRYAELIRACLDGSLVTTRNAKCYRTIAHTARFTSAPLVCARRAAWKNALREWEWFMSGSCAIADLHPSVRSWWEPWANSEGIVPHNYSQQFRNFVGYDDRRADQIALFIDGVQNHPFSRRNVITTWNAADMVAPDCPITNCHNTATQAFVEPDDSLHIVTYQRSADVVCGVPHNWIQMWAFLMWVAHRTGRTVGSLTWVGGDCHVYESHVPLARRILDAQPARPAPELVYTPTSDEFRADDFTLSCPYLPTFAERAEMVV